MLAVVVFCNESNIYESKKLIPIKQLSIFFTGNFELEQHIENTSNNHSEVFLQSVFLESRQILEKNLWWNLFFGEIESWKPRTLLILNSYEDILSKISLEFWVISDNFLKF